MVITEDSDLLAFGVERVLFKMDTQGNGVEINLMLIYDKSEESSIKKSEIIKIIKRYF